MESQNGKEERNKNNTPTKIPSASTIQRLLHPITPLTFFPRKSDLYNPPYNWIGRQSRYCVNGTLLVYQAEIPIAHMGMHSISPFQQIRPDCVTTVESITREMVMKFTRKHGITTINTPLLFSHRYAISTQYTCYSNPLFSRNLT